MPRADKTSGSLSQESRARALQDLQTTTIDLLVIGGGITGAGTALDAATRGLDVALVEQGDLASGTSSKSSKMIHGGLRYLEQLRFGLVHEALAERELLATVIAPHLVRPIPFLVPINGWIERLYYGVGVWLYDWLARKGSFPKARHLSREDAERIAGSLRTNRHSGAIQFWDAQEDDARYVVEVARTAAAHGARICTYVRVENLLRNRGRVSGVICRDLESDETFTVRARHVVCATGASSQQLTHHKPPSPRIRPSKGVHILLRRDRLELQAGLIGRTPTGLLFIIPWGDHWLVGDTDTDWDDRECSPVADSADIGILLDRLNAVLTADIRRSDIVSTFAGLRPLAATTPGGDSKSISRSHVVTSPEPGLTEIFGGKYTTYRLMAEAVVDRALLDLPARLRRPSYTRTIQLIGADRLIEMKTALHGLAVSTGLPLETLERLLSRYGSRMSEVLDLHDSKRAVEAGETLLEAEILHACRHEGALHLGDILDRRTRLSLTSPETLMALTERVSRILAKELSWSDSRRLSERDAYLHDWHQSQCALSAHCGRSSQSQRPEAREPSDQS